MSALSSYSSWVTLEMKKAIVGRPNELDFYYTLGETSKRKLKDDDVIAIMKDRELVTAEEVTVIRLYGCVFISDKTLVYISEHCPKLQKLGVAQCSVTDAGIKAITSKCPKLTFLSFSQCSKVTDAVLEDLPTQCPHLEELHAQWCNIRKLPSSISTLKNIKVLHLDYNFIRELPRNITYLKSTCKDFKIGNNYFQPPLREIVEEGFDAIDAFFLENPTGVSSTVLANATLPYSNYGSTEKRGQKLLSDTDIGRDLLDLDIVAKVFAEYIASSDLEPPFVLGIIGKWGSGKSFFFSLVKKHLIEIQKQSVENNEKERHFVGHMYFVKFDAWTYSKKNLWASLMFRIFHDLNEQLELEQKLQETRDLKKGGVSVMELVEKLSSNEKDYLKKLVQDGVNVDEILDNQTNNGRVSCSFTEVFATRMKKDREELKHAQKRLTEKTNKSVWDRALQSDNGIGMGAMNIFRRVVVNKIKGATGDKREELMRKSIGEIFQEEFNVFQRGWIYVRSTPLLSWAMLVLIVAILIASIILWNFLDTEGFSTKVSIGLGSLGSSIGVLIKWYRSVFEYGAKCAEEFSEQRAQARNLVSDIETAFSDAYKEGIREEQNQIAQIKDRLSVLEGESMYEVVKNRVDSSLYLNHLGIVHRAQEDLRNLSESMFKKYEQEQFAKNDDLKSNAMVKFLDVMESPFKNSASSTEECKTMYIKRKVPVLILIYKEKEIKIWTFTGKSTRMKINIVMAENNTSLEMSIGEDQSEKKMWDLKNITIDYMKKAATFFWESDGLKQEISFDDIYRFIEENSSKQEEPASTCWWRCCSSKKSNDKQKQPPVKSKNTYTMFPRGEPRIVLFIDDLDRCEPEAVIQILETMQLLVKSKLFVVVAAIDSRYVCRSLETKKYENILTSEGSPTGLDFLEKIIQIPYNLPMLSNNVMNKYVERQVYLKSNFAASEDSESYDQAKGTESRGTHKSSQLEQNMMRDYGETIPLLPRGDNNTEGTSNEGDPGHFSVSQGGEENLGSDVVEYELQQFSPMEVGLLKTACRSFKLVPRSVKRIVNTFKIMKILWHRKNEDVKPGVTSHSLLLLAMASSEKTRDVTQMLFNMMEENKRPNSNAQNLRELIMELCERSNVNIYLPHFESYKIETDEEWIEVSKTFQITRCFCFFRTMNIQDEESKDEVSSQDKDSITKT